ncbi:MAG: hypothetical protein RLZZ618_2750 [Pseudomonadota bacterium]|jgi:signal transduction histidine kinase/CheY-like chemotaxis protein
MSGRPEASLHLRDFSEDDVLARRVNDAQARILFRHALLIAVASMLFSLLMTVGLSPYIAAPLAWGWLALRVLASALRLAVSLGFFRTPEHRRDLWRRSFLVAIGVDGLTWGLVGIVVVPLHIPQVSELVLLALVGVATSGSFNLQPSWRANACFVASLVLPLALYELLFDGRFGLYACLGLCLFVLLVLFEARGAERRIRELLRLRITTDQIAEERAEALRLAQRQSTVKGQFLATMSHEMRTPLHGILGLTRGLREADPQNSQLALIERAGEHLLILINDVLDFSKLEAGQVRLQNHPFDLAALVDEVVSLSMAPACQAGLTLSTRLHMPRPCIVQGDAARLRQVLHNLVGNAVKFTESGAVTVVVKHNAERGRARIAVHDTGVGIAPDELKLIFDAFHQADSSFTRRFAGTGLGLTIARDLARAMGGDLVATSQPARGSCFTVTLSLPQATVDLPLDIQATVPATLSGRVLLAEDNPVNALVAEAVLQKMGLEVEVVGDGAQALASFQARRPDLVLLDCQMPVMDGLEAARRMREHEQHHGGPSTPIVALTANALDGDREQSLLAGMDEHIAKPFRDEELQAVLARFLHRTG